MPRFRPKKDPKVNYFATETKTEMIARWEKDIVQIQEMYEQKLREGDITGANKCQQIEKEYREAIARERERLALLHIKQK